MASVTVRLPGLLVSGVGLPETLCVEGETVGDALQRLVESHPQLGVHLFDEAGSLRQHVLCLHNGENTRWSGDEDPRVSDGDEIRIMQAVSGG